MILSMFLFFEVSEAILYCYKGESCQPLPGEDKPGRCSKQLCRNHPSAAMCFYLKNLKTLKTYMGCGSMRDSTPLIPDPQKILNTCTEQLTPSPEGEVRSLLCVCKASLCNDGPELND